MEDTEEENAVLSSSKSLGETAQEGDGDKEAALQEVDEQNVRKSLAPTDKYKLVYLIFVLHGVGTLMPWNMFINAKDYFEKFKLNPVKTTSDDDAYWYSTYFFTFLVWASQIPNLVFNWCNLVFPCGGNVKKRIMFSLTAEVLVCVLTVTLAWANTEEQPKLFFWLTMLSVVIMNVAGGMYQNSIYGIGAKIRYTGAIVLGSNLSGVFTSVTYLMILSTRASQLKSAVLYFCFSTLIIILCVASYWRLNSFKFYRFYHTESHCTEKVMVHEPRNDNNNDAMNNASPVDKCDQNERALKLSVFKECWVQCFNVFMVYFVTLTIFPAVYANVKAHSRDFVITDEQYFVGVTCFLTFNVTALLGNLIAGFVQWPKPNHLWIAVILRLLLIPFFLLCNYHPIGFTRSVNTIWFGDWPYWIGGVVLGLTNGYFSSLAMMYCPRMVKCNQAAIAGELSAAFLVTGVFFGINFSAVMPFFIASKNN